MKPTADKSLLLEVIRIIHREITILEGKRALTNESLQIQTERLCELSKAIRICRELYDGEHE